MTREETIADLMAWNRIRKFAKERAKELALRLEDFGVGGEKG